ncbi:helicase HerA domain-containing protein [Brevibacillus sp. SYSU BS000544]|uniref:helicase HerA domain-containing protein n=1 Tax=Brevibacillus sp. SYSU BS000544 TaxID=3416443 RepID=UPI003CE57D5C
MLAYAQRILKNWKKEEDHIVINALEGKDTKNGHHVRVLLIKDYPPAILAGYLDDLDEIAKKEGAVLRKTVRYAPAQIRFNWAMKNKMKRLKRSIDAATDTDPARKEEIDAYQTIVSLRDSQTNHSSKLIDFWTFLTISAEKKHQLETVTRAFNDWFDHMEAKLDDLTKEQIEAMRQTSIVSDPHTDAAEFFTKHHYGRVITDSAAARTFPFTNGSISDTDGVYFGRRAEDGSFVFINLCDPHNPHAQNITVFGKTGEGKSFFMKALAISLLEEGVYVFAFDLTGEWQDLCTEAGGVYIDHTSENGRYFEPLTIFPKLEEMDAHCVSYNKLRYHRAQENSVRTLSLLTEGLSKGELFLVGRAIRKTFEDAGIYKNEPETWDHTEQETRPTIHKLYNNICSLEVSEQDKKHQESLIDKLRLYFDEEGIYYGIFREEEKQTFLNNPLVIFKVGHGVLSEQNKDDERSKQAQLKMSMAFDFVNANLQYLKLQGVSFSAVFVDEGQRQLKNAELRATVFEWYTSIRHANGMMILGSNTPAIMLDTAEGKGMWENTSLRVYFFMEQSAVDMLARDTDVPAEIRDKISANEKSQKYVLEYHGSFDELRMDVPPEEAACYKTRGLRTA